MPTGPGEVRPQPAPAEWKRLLDSYVGNYQDESAPNEIAGLRARGA